MIIGLWHPGSGVGDQLFCYLAARITAERLGVPFRMVGTFKGKDFIPLDGGDEFPIMSRIEYPAGKIVINNDWPVYEGKTYYDPEFYFIKDNAIVDGCRIQDERYFAYWPINEWLQTEPLAVANDTCIIGFRGGEYSMIPELFLPQEYWDKCMARMREINPDMQFHVVTDDPDTARRFFPDFVITHDVSMDWKKIRYAKYAIIANSAFYILPRLLNEKKGMTLAPRYWARRNIQEWSTPQNYYKSFRYI